MPLVLNIYVIYFFPFLFLFLLVNHSTHFFPFIFLFSSQPYYFTSFLPTSPFPFVSVYTLFSCDFFPKWLKIHLLLFFPFGFSPFIQPFLIYASSVKLSHFFSSLFRIPSLFQKRLVTPSVWIISSRFLLFIFYFLLISLPKA